MKLPRVYLTESTSRESSPANLKSGSIERRSFYGPTSLDDDLVREDKEAGLGEDVRV